LLLLSGKEGIQKWIQPSCLTVFQNLRKLGRFLTIFQIQEILYFLSKIYIRKFTENFDHLAEDGGRWTESAFGI